MGDVGQQHDLEGPPGKALHEVAAHQLEALQPGQAVAVGHVLHDLGPVHQHGVPAPADELPGEGSRSAAEVQHGPLLRRPLQAGLHHRGHQVRALVGHGGLEPLEGLPRAGLLPLLLLRRPPGPERLRQVRRPVPEVVEPEEDGIPLVVRRVPIDQGGAGGPGEPPELSGVRAHQVHLLQRAQQDAGGPGVELRAVGQGPGVRGSLGQGVDDAPLQRRGRHHRPLGVAPEVPQVVERGHALRRPSRQPKRPVKTSGWAAVCAST